MGTVWNFAAGPAVMPAEVLARIGDELIDFRGSGHSLLETPFTGAVFREVVSRAEADLRALLSIPDDYAVLFLQGGASAQFALVPLNLLDDAERADYIETGYWARKSIA